jgi:hypothetical protein
MVIPQGLRFSLPAHFAKNGINRVEVKLTPEDTYKVTFSKIGNAPSFKATEVYSADNIYAEDLTRVFERETGLTLNMPKIHRAGAEAVTATKPKTMTDTRTEHAIDIDKAIRAEEVVSPTNKEGVEKWEEHPERLDVQGIDTPPTKQARKPRIKAEKPKAVKPTEHKEPTTYVVSLDDNRTPHAVAIDRGIQAKDVVTRRNKAGVSRWRSHPNQMDVSGVDTRRRKSKPPTRAILDRRGHYHKQKRGSVV